ncbi:pyruvate dehydrogenase complex dihydrolipoamide acetyltransferase [Sphingorhabdus sp. EL138]|uniref:pyruvate dehydrogenase complex dihydrolipoamide acetyltransferase n=1 Tax=Sphingorhabdus sp. EL138 TaxID=2073156 RepID=UPI002600333F|nr:pyruvate dehydrogenase complex dihydrolipoamide acetyltransferase [Sphingorhabdus sp. EL138]
MPIELKMPALSPTMEEGTLARWLVKEGDKVSSGDLLAEIETDKATMEFEAVDEGIVTKILVAEGTDGVKVGAVIAMIQGEDDEDAVAGPSSSVALPQPLPPAGGEQVKSVPETKLVAQPAIAPLPQAGGVGGGPAPSHSNDRVKASPLAKRIAVNKGLDLTSVAGTGPNGRIVKADVDALSGESRSPVVATALNAGPRAEAPMANPVAISTDIPHEVVKLSNMRKTIARRLTESKQTVPHIYLTVDVRLDALLKLRGELNASLEGRGIKLSVNDMLIKALGLALMQVPKCNVSFAGDNMLQYARADISVAVSVPTGLITPIITDAANKSLSKISTEVAELAGRAKDGKLQPHEYQGGTASISNMGMMGIKQFDAVINPPQAMILAVGAGEKRPYIVDDALAIATVMSVTGSFDHRAIDGADGAMFMKVFKELVEKPLGLVA